MRTQVKNRKRPTINIPLAGLRCLTGYPKEKKVICEISIDELKQVNEPKTIDEIISSSRLDYALGNFKTFNSADDLIKDLRS